MCVIPTARPSCRRSTVRGWSALAVGNPNDGDRSAEHGVAADRFAREIVGFWHTPCGALAAAEHQTVGRRIMATPNKRLSLRTFERVML
jgi:hypothetical protein